MSRSALLFVCPGNLVPIRRCANQDAYQDTYQNPGFSLMACPDTSEPTQSWVVMARNRYEYGILYRSNSPASWRAHQSMDVHTVHGGRAGNIRLSSNPRQLHAHGRMQSNLIVLRFLGRGRGGRGDNNHHTPFPGPQQAPGRALFAAGYGPGRRTCPTAGPCRPSVPSSRPILISCCPPTPVSHPSLFTLSSIGGTMILTAFLSRPGHC